MRTSPIAAHRNQQGGFTIIEMMIAVVISLVILAGVSVLLVGVLKNRAELEKSNRQIENGRYALEVLSEDLRLAGYFGVKLFGCEEIYGNTTCVGSGTTGSYLNRVGGLAAVTLPTICETNVANWIRSAGTAPDYTSYTTNYFLWSVQGYNNRTTFPETACLTAGAPPISTGMGGGGTDILVVRRQSTDGVAAGSLVNTQPYLQTGATAGDAQHTLAIKVGAGGGGTVFDLERVSGTAYVTADVNRLLTHIYFIAPCSRGTGTDGVCVSGDDSIPTLKRLELTTGPSFRMVNIAEGIEDINFEYGLDSDRDGSPDTYTATPTTTDWWNVVAVRIYILARNIDASDAGSEQKTFNLGIGKTGLSSTQTQFKRHVFTQAVRINNVSMRRE